jgi:hypothetical protein
MMPSSKTRRAVQAGVFAILFGSYAFFWHARDWNTASRLMLTYALVDRGTVCINGLEDHTRDRARIGRDFYSDKGPGLSILAVPATIAAKVLLGLPAHPLHRKGKGFDHWPTDYWATLGTSGVASALVGVLLVGLAFDLGCGPRRAALVGLAYGLATPAYVYATLSYGHQAAACALLLSFQRLWKQAPQRPRPSRPAALAGLFAALAVVVELSLAPVAAILGLFLVVQVSLRRLPPSTLPAFVVYGLAAILVLLLYNLVAFGSPWDMGYTHEDLHQFQAVHSAQNPLGLRWPPVWSRLLPLTIGGYRGLLFYAPIVGLAPFGCVTLVRMRQWSVATVSLSACLAVLLVNLCYPEWTGGWSTGPRLLVPMLPFAMLPVAALLARSGAKVFAMALVLTVLGATLMLLFQAIGGRVPQDVLDPLRGFVLPAWRHGNFTRTVVSTVFPQAVASLPVAWRWLQFIPLFVFQSLGIGVLLGACRRRMMS